MMKMFTVNFCFWLDMDKDNYAKKNELSSFIGQGILYFW